jgi:hypothetical protein
MTNTVTIHNHGPNDPNPRDEIIAELIEALDGCLEHLEHSTTQGRESYKNALTILTKAREVQS